MFSYKILYTYLAVGGINKALTVTHSLKIYSLEGLKEGNRYVTVEKEMIPNMLLIQIPRIRKSWYN